MTNDKRQTTAKEHVLDVADSVAESANNRVDRATSTLGKTMEQAASRLRDVDSPERMANKLSAASTYLEDANLSSLTDDLGGLIRRHPIPAALAAVGVGYLIAKLTS